MVNGAEPASIKLVLFTAGASCSKVNQAGKCGNVMYARIAKRVVHNVALRHRFAHAAWHFINSIADRYLPLLFMYIPFDINISCSNQGRYSLEVMTALMVRLEDRLNFKDGFSKDNEIQYVFYLRAVDHNISDRIRPQMYKFGIFILSSSVFY